MGMTAPVIVEVPRKLTRAESVVVMEQPVPLTFAPQVMLIVPDHVLWIQTKPQPRTNVESVEVIQVPVQDVRILMHVTIIWMQIVIMDHVLIQKKILIVMVTVP